MVNSWGLLRSFFDSYENLRIRGLILVNEDVRSFSGAFRDFKYEIQLNGQFLRFTEKFLWFIWKSENPRAYLDEQIFEEDLQSF